jgi:hypothetical protein
MNTIAMEKVKRKPEFVLAVRIILDFAANADFRNVVALLNGA